MASTTSYYPRKNNRRPYKKNQYKVPYCDVCFKAGKDKSVYSNHWIRETPDPNSPITCPLILSTVCGYCKETGHSIKYCQKRLRKHERTNYCSDTVPSYDNRPPSPTTSPFEEDYSSPSTDWINATSSETNHSTNGWVILSKQGILDTEPIPPITCYHSYQLPVRPSLPCPPPANSIPSAWDIHHHNDELSDNESFTSTDLYDFLNPGVLNSYTPIPSDDEFGVPDPDAVDYDDEEDYYTDDF